MGSRHRLRHLSLVLAASSHAFAQTSAPVPVDPLKQLSAALQALSSRVGKSVVQVFATGYSLEEDAESGKAAMFSRQRSSGSGVIVSSDGYIVTNSHVVKGATTVKVHLFVAGSATYARGAPGPSSLLSAKVVGMDSESDLAVLKVEKSNLPALPFGDSDEVKQGQLVLAFGNPLGLENSVSMGVVSSTSRQMKPDDSMVYIQTDAPINPGNSGGPLLDPDGRVMGINTFILSQSGGSEGIGFAIPSNLVAGVYRQIREHGHVRRGQIGVFPQTIDADLAKGLDLPRDTGVIFADVLPESPAAEAGVQIGDILISVDTRPISNARQLHDYLYGRHSGEKIRLEILRGTEKLPVVVAIAEKEEEAADALLDLVSPENNTISKLGIIGIEVGPKIASLVSELRRPYGVVVAARSADSSQARTGGLQVGDVIYALNTRKIETIESLRAELDHLRADDPLILQIERDGKLLFLSMLRE